MAAPFETRVRTALENPDFRIGGYASLIAEGEQLIERHRAIAARAQDESVDFALGQPDREEAAQRADRASREAAMLSGAITALRAKHAEREASEAAQAVNAKRQAIIARRDALAERFKAEVPPAVEALTALLGEIAANDEELRAARMPDASAEAVARGVPANWVMEGAEIRRFTQMIVPAWDGLGRCWPKSELNAPLQNWREQDREIKKLVAANVAKAAARYGWFRLTGRGGAQHSFQYQVVLPTRGPTGHMKTRGIGKKPWSGNIPRAEAERLRDLGVTVEEISQELALAEQAEREADE